MVVYMQTVLITEEVSIRELRDDQLEDLATCSASTLELPWWEVLSVNTALRGGLPV